MKRCYNLGAQIHYFESHGDCEWVNQDIVGSDPNIKVDLVCDAAKLPLEDNSVDFIYCGHLIEHFYPNTVKEAIMEWRRVLKSGGTLVIVTPDCGATFRDYAEGKFGIESTWQQIYGRIYDYDTPSERHHIALDWDMLTKVCGFENWVGIAYKNHHLWSFAKVFNFNNPPEELVPFMDKHISRGAYQLGIICQK